MGRVTSRTRMTRLTVGSAVGDSSAGDSSVGAESVRIDTVVVEEPLEIRLGDQPLSVTMRTPGADVELAQGFLLTEGVIARREDISTIRYCEGAGTDGSNTYNVLRVDLAPGVAAPDIGITRNFYTTSSCGICGKASLDAVRLRSQHSPAQDRMTIDRTVLAQLPATLREHQQVFAATGGLHAAALFDSTGELLVVREDVGRHNAVDKVIGWALEHRRVPAEGCVLLVSGRASFELTQKAVMTGIPVLAAVSAPSSLAVDLAAESGLTLVGFLRGDTMNVYARPDRVT